MKRSLLLTAGLCCLVSSVVAQPTYRAPMQYGSGNHYPRSPMMPKPNKPRSEVEEAAVVLKAGLGKLMAFFKGDKPPSPQQIVQFLDREIAPYFDFAYMAKWAAGGLYGRLNVDQKKKLETDIKAQFLTTMAQKLTTFSNQTVTYLRPKVSGRNQVELSIAIGNPGSYPARLDFRMYKGNDGWKVYDVSANGSSAMMYYRQYYRKKLHQQLLPPRFRR